jgi:hypothetical protein
VPTAPPGTDFAAVAAFQLEASELMRRVNGAGEEIGRARERLRYMRSALVETPRAEAALFGRLDEITAELTGLQTQLYGERTRQRLDESTAPSISDRVGRVIYGHWDTRQAPTATHRGSLEIARGDFALLLRDLSTLLEIELVQLESDLEAAGAPWTPGRKLP